MEVTGNTPTSHIIKGLVLAAILIAYAVVGEVAHTSHTEWFGWVKVVLLAIGTITGVLTYAAQLQGNVNFSQLLVHGLKMTAVVTCLYFIFSLLEIYVFFPGSLDEMVKLGLAEAAKNGKIDQQKVTENMGQARKVVAIMLLAGVVMGTMIMGLLAALFGAVLAKKNPVA